MTDKPEITREQYRKICETVGMMDSAEGQGPIFPDVDELCRYLKDVADNLRTLEESHFMANSADSWHEEDGEVLWWRFPVQEAPYVGSPLCEDWHEDYYTHWTKLPIPWEIPPAEAQP